MSLLTTTSIYRRWRNESGTGKDVAIERAIKAASGAIETYLDRILGEDTYSEWQNGRGERGLVLNQWPVQRVYAVSTDIEDAIRTIQGPSPVATIQVTETGVVLFSVSSSGAETITEILFSAQATVSDMATAIAAVSGWSATEVSAYSEKPSKAMRPMVGTDAVSPAQAEIEIADEPLEDARLDELEDNLLVAPWPFPHGHQNVFVWYKAGYVVPTDDASGSNLSNESSVTLPWEIIEIANLGVAALRDSAGSDFGAEASERIGSDYSYAMTPESRRVLSRVVEEHAHTLSRYRRITFGG